MTEISVPESIVVSTPIPDTPKDQGNMQRYKDLSENNTGKINGTPADIATERNSNRIPKGPGRMTRAVYKSWELNHRLANESGIKPLINLIDRVSPLERVPKVITDPFYREVYSKVDSLAKNDRLVTAAINSGDKLEIEDAMVRAFSKAAENTWGELNQTNPGKVQEMLKLDPTIQRAIDNYRVKQIRSELTKAGKVASEQSASSQDPASVNSSESPIGKTEAEVPLEQIQTQITDLTGEVESLWSHLTQEQIHNNDVLGPILEDYAGDIDLLIEGKVNPDVVKVLEGIKEEASKVIGKDRVDQILSEYKAKKDIEQASEMTEGVGASIISSTTPNTETVSTEPKDSSPGEPIQAPEPQGAVAESELPIEERISQVSAEIRRVEDEHRKLVETQDIDAQLAKTYEYDDLIEKLNKLIEERDQALVSTQTNS